VLVAFFAPAGLPNPAAKPLDLAIQQEQSPKSYPSEAAWGVK
jgi:hypothetical protein